MDSGESRCRDVCPQESELRMRDLTEKQFVAAMLRNGFTKDESLLNGFRHPDLPEVMFMTMLIQVNGYRGALKTALETLKKAQAQKAA
jgi:hypothetical protein